MKPIFIISGDKGSGKSTFLLDVLALMQLNEFVAGGFVSIHEIERDSYFIKNIKTNQHSLLMQRVATFNERPNHFIFFPDGVKMGNNCIQEVLDNPPDIAVIDEIGGYELLGKLWCSSFRLLVESSLPLIFTTKAKYLEEVKETWRLEPTIVFDLTDFVDPKDAFESITSSIK